MIFVFEAAMFFLLGRRLLVSMKKLQLQNQSQVALLVFRFEESATNGKIPEEELNKCRWMAFLTRGTPESSTN
jgi:hypothetical protein